MGIRNNIVRDGRVDCLHFHASDLRVHLSIPCQNLMIQQNFLFKLKLYCGFSVIKLTGLTGLCLNNKCLVLGRSGPELTSSLALREVSVIEELLLSSLFSHGRVE